MNRCAKVDDPAAALSEFLDAPAPDSQGSIRKKTITQYYSKRHWTERILFRYQIIRSRDEQDWEALVTTGLSEGQKPPKVISAIMEAVAEAWAEESDEFKVELETEREAEYSTPVKEALKESEPMERTPERYQ